jgi:alpha-L-arabinofuranosidase
MRGSSLDIHVSTPSQDLVYTGPTKPDFVKDLTVHTPDSAKLTKYVDVSAVLASTAGGREIRVALLNRHASEEFTVPILFGPAVTLKDGVKVYQIWHEDIKATNGFEGEKVKTEEREETFEGSYKLKKHSFQGELQRNSYRSYRQPPF